MNCSERPLEVEQSRFLKPMPAQQDKPTKITLLDGEVLICTPLQPIEEEYESYLIELIESSLNYGDAGNLSEVCGRDIKMIEPMEKQ